MNRREFHLSLLAAAGLSVTRGSPRARSQPTVNGERLLRVFRALAEFGKTPAGGVTRLAYSPEDRAARDYFMGQMRAAGLAVRVDAAANIIGRRDGDGRDLPPLMMGSHIDSVPDGGAYDGNVGSLGALEAAWAMHDHAVRTRHPVEVVIFQNEEGGLVGSNLMAGTLRPGQLDQAAQSGKTIRDGIALLGGDPEGLGAARRRPGEIAAYVELHIEQGGILDAEDIDLGVVEGIVGIEQWDVVVEGFANHAGTTPMDQRRDALLAAARFIDAANAVVRSVPGRQVGTVGQIRAYPGAPNVIPGRVELSLEIRDLDGEKIRALFERMRTEAAAIGRATGTAFTFTSRQLNVVPAPTDPRIRRIIAHSAEGLGLTHQTMPSGAGHDAQSLAPLCPIGMLFVPSVGGISHSPKEFTRPEDLVNGANVLLRTMLALDREL